MRVTLRPTLPLLEGLVSGTEIRTDAAAQLLAFLAKLLPKQPCITAAAQLLPRWFKAGDVFASTRKPVATRMMDDLADGLIGKEPLVEC